MNRKPSTAETFSLITGSVCYSCTILRIFCAQVVISKGNKPKDLTQNSTAILNLPPYSKAIWILCSHNNLLNTDEHAWLNCDNGHMTYILIRTESGLPNIQQDWCKRTKVIKCSKKQKQRLPASVQHTIKEDPAIRNSETHNKWREVLIPIVGYLISHMWSLWMEENRTASLVLIHQTGVLKMCNKGSFTLDACICKRSYFLTVELLPFFPIESLSVRSNESLSAWPREHGQKPEVCAHRESFSAGNTCLHKPTPVKRSTDPKEVSEYKMGVASTHLIEGYNAGRCYHVDECITHITLILQSCFPNPQLSKDKQIGEQNQNSRPARFW